MDPGRQAEFFVEGRFELRQSFFSTEGLGSSDKDDLVSLFFRSGDDLLYGLGRDEARDSRQSGQKKKCRDPTGLYPRSDILSLDGRGLTCQCSLRPIHFI